jgi:molybdopterin converting factor subunit 1
MKVTVRLFARAKDLAGAESVELDVPEGATVADLRKHLALERPQLAVILERSALGMNEEFVGDERELSPGAEVVVLPPVSGGS